MIREGVVETFKKFLTYPREWRANLANLKFSIINEVEAATLEQPFSEVEVEVALKDLNGDKVLRLDGLIVAFFFIRTSMRLFDNLAGT